MNKAGQGVPRLLADIIKASGDIWSLGWCEANGGNISVRLTEEDLEGFALKPGSQWVPTRVSLPELGGERFMVTGTMCYLRNIPVCPERNLGIIELDGRGENYRVLWGLEPDIPPTSELPAHLKSHDTAKMVSGGRDRAVIHAHTQNLVALTYMYELTTPQLTKLLWQCHAECVAVFPAGMELIPWMMTGSGEIADATSAALGRRTMALWQYHGAVARGSSLDTALGAMYVAEKVAGIYLAAMAAGGIRSVPSDDIIRRIADRFGVTPAADCIGEDTSLFFKKT